MSKDFLTPTKDGTRLDLKVSPGAKRSSMEGSYGERALKLRVAAAPADPKAELERFLAGSLGVFVPALKPTHALTPYSLISGKPPWI